MEEAGSSASEGQEWQDEHAQEGLSRSEGEPSPAAAVLSAWRAAGCPPVVLGVDGGGTSTTAVALRASPLPGSEGDRGAVVGGGRAKVHCAEEAMALVVGRGVAGSSNRNSVGGAAACAALQLALARALAAACAPRDAVRSVVACMAGVDRPADVRRCTAWLRKWFPLPVHIAVHNDAVAALASGTLGDVPGAIGLAPSLPPNAPRAVDNAHDSLELAALHSHSSPLHGRGREGRHDMADAEAAVSSGGSAAADGGRDGDVGQDGGSDSRSEEVRWVNASMGGGCGAAAEDCGPIGAVGAIVAIAGTGTIVYGFRSDGAVARASGAGPLLGDRGSGYSIASEALSAVMRASDGRGPPTQLSHAILSHLHLASSQDLIGWAYESTNAPWARVAALLPVVRQCAAQGDDVALRIVQENVRELSNAICAVARRLRLAPHPHPQPQPQQRSDDDSAEVGTSAANASAESERVVIIAAGGVLESGSSSSGSGSKSSYGGMEFSVLELLRKQLAADLPCASLRLPQVDAAVGAALLALQCVITPR